MAKMHTCVRTKTTYILNSVDDTSTEHVYFSVISNDSSYTSWKIQKSTGF